MKVWFSVPFLYVVILLHFVEEVAIWKEEWYSVAMRFMEDVGKENYSVCPRHYMSLI